MRETSNGTVKDFDRRKAAVKIACDQARTMLTSSGSRAGCKSLSSDDIGDSDIRTVEHIQHGIQAARRAGAVSDESVAIFLAGYLA